MKKIKLMIGILALGTVQACWASSGPPDVAKYLSQRDWTAYDGKARLTMPTDDIAPVMYYAKGSNVPSCGLLSSIANAPEFLEILAAEPGEQYPNCPGINDAAAFKLAGKDYVVVEYSNRDSRNETYEEFFYVYKNRTGQYETDKQLNKEAGNADSASRTPPPKAIDGIRLARAYALKQQQPGMELQTRDLMIDGTITFAVFKDKGSATCSFVIDNGDALTKYSSDVFTEHGKCINYLASSKLDTATKTYYLGIFKGSDPAIKIAILSVTKDTAAVHAEKELAQSAAATGRVNDIRSLKAYLTSAEKK